MKQLFTVFIRKSIPLLTCLLLAAGVLCRGLPALAGELPAEDLDPGRKASLTVELVYTGEDASYPLKGAVIELYQVASLVTEGGGAFYDTADAFAGSGLDFTGMTAKESAQAAEKLAQLVKKEGIRPLASARTDADGRALFTDLDPGIYLGIQASPVTVGGKYKVTFGESLWLAPMYELTEDKGGYRWNYSLLVQPKAAPEVEKTPPGRETPPPRIRTGDDQPVRFYALLCAGSALCMLVMVLLGLDRRQPQR